MDTMQLRVARAIASRYLGREVSDEFLLKPATGGYIYMEAAADAIAAMQEPSKPQRLAMQSALLDNYPRIVGGEVAVNGALLKSIYRSAITAALTETPTTSAA